MKLMICIALATAAGLVGGVAEPPASRASGTDPTAEATSALVCEPFDDSHCDPAVNCEVSSGLVPCSDGVIMFAWQTPDCRFCINRDVCDGHGGLIICPEL